MIWIDLSWLDKNRLTLDASICFNIYWASKSLLNRLRHVRSMLRVDCPRLFSSYFYINIDLYSKGIWTSTAGRIGQDVINPTIHRTCSGLGSRISPRFGCIKLLRNWECVYTVCILYDIWYNRFFGSAIIASKLDLFFPLISGYQACCIPHCHVIDQSLWAIPIFAWNNEGMNVSKITCQMLTTFFTLAGWHVCCWDPPNYLDVVFYYEMYSYDINIGIYIYVV